VPVSSFTFEKHFVLHPGRVVKVRQKINSFFLYSNSFNTFYLDLGNE
jgi:hypothetical protein